MKNLNTIVPFYDSTDEWYKYRDDMVLNQKQIRLVCGTGRLLPWLIRRPTTGGTTTTLTYEIYNANTGALIQTPVSATYLGYTTGTTYDYIKHLGTINLATPLTQGTEVYVKLTDTSQTPTKIYYSEIFMVVPDIADYIKIEFWDDEQVNNILEDFHQILYIDNSLKTPDYIREDEGEKIDGVMLRQKSTVQKVLNLRNLLTPEYMLDSLMTLPLLDNVQVTNLLADCIVPLETRIKDPEWISDTGGVYAKLEIQFVEWIVIKKGGYKEMACNCTSGSSAVINEGTATLTANTPLLVTFSEAFSGTGYSLSTFGYTGWGSPTFPVVTLRTATTFTIESNVDCFVDWIAVMV